MQCVACNAYCAAFLDNKDMDFVVNLFLSTPQFTAGSVALILDALVPGEVLEQLF